MVNAPMRMADALVESLNLADFRRLYKNVVVVLTPPK